MNTNYSEPMYITLKSSNDNCNIFSEQYFHQKQNYYKESNLLFPSNKSMLLSHCTPFPYSNIKVQEYWYSVYNYINYQNTNSAIKTIKIMTAKLAAKKMPVMLETKLEKIEPIEEKIKISNLFKSLEKPLYYFKSMKTSIHSDDERKKILSRLIYEALNI